MRAAALALLLAACAATPSPAPVQPPVDRPNVLFLAIDDLNDWVGCLGGHPQAVTPHLDALAARGTLFTNAHCQAPLCNPSRTSVLTGRRPSSTGVHGLAPFFRDVPALADLPTIPRHLADHGWSLASTGKILHGGYGRRASDDELGELGPPAGVGARPPAPLVETPSGHPLVDWGTFPHRDEDKGDWKVASWAVEQLDAGLEEPFFLSVGFFLPHVPCYATEPWFAPFPAGGTSLPATRAEDRDDTPRASWYLHWDLPEPRLRFLEEAGEWEHHVRAYLASTSFVDAQVGRVLDALERSGHADDTVVVLWSDHGYHLGEKGVSGKNTLWEESTRVPLVLAGPGVAVGARCGRPVELLDLFPTLAELCGVPAPPGLEGESLGPLLRDARAPRARPAITTHNRGNHAVRSERWRYVRYADGTEELYDHASDPQEWVNLAGDPAHADVLAAHARWLPTPDVAAVAGSAHRVLTWEDGVPVWQGRPIEADAPVPGLD